MIEASASEATVRPALLDQIEVSLVAGIWSAYTIAAIIGLARGVGSYFTTVIRSPCR
jgi:hypothetical protein